MPVEHFRSKKAEMKESRFPPHSRCPIHRNARRSSRKRQVKTPTSKAEEDQRRTEAQGEVPQTLNVMYYAYMEGGMRRDLKVRCRERGAELGKL